VADKFAYRPEEAAELASIGRTTMYLLIADGEIESFKVGRARLIPHDALVAFLERRRAAEQREREALGRAG
jgi:excisionase family DNA binding protein